VFRSWEGGKHPQPFIHCTLGVMTLYTLTPVLMDSCEGVCTAMQAPALATAAPLFKGAGGAQNYSWSMDNSRASYRGRRGLAPGGSPGGGGGSLACRGLLRHCLLVSSLLTSPAPLSGMSPEGGWDACVLPSASTGGRQRHGAGAAPPWKDAAFVSPVTITDHRVG